MSGGGWISSASSWLPLYSIFLVVAEWICKLYAWWTHL
jgi:hypothetical protein